MRGDLGQLRTAIPDIHAPQSGKGIKIGVPVLIHQRAAMAGFETSETFYVVFNLGLEEDDYEASVDWVSANLVPAPGVLALLGMGGLAVRRRRG